ncbi:uncharacterized protein TNIN_212521 [Trichonephila inaurata madagascariensis]|uniref:Uncharacterized protein n=1 Tax=Trichonephila inaurata madagascariensis TaxID=2747483 RepID=A0A8X6YCT4_9ARAC|nr:uncharacterized protein TNIN_212521 [Trichonephila inaurata madagascariensis]
MDDIPDYDDDFYELDSTAGSYVKLSHLNNKSSVLSPESKNISSQYLALQQLEAHQRMISRAKSIIDTSAPKSLQSYISVVDRQRKKNWGKLYNESNISSVNVLDLDHRPATSTRLQTSFSEEDDNMSLNTSVNKGVQTGIPFKNFSSKTADKITWYLEALRHGELQSPLFLGNDSSRYSKHSHSLDRKNKKIIKGDIIDWHKEHFVNPSKPFSPRILVDTNAKSKVREMRCYNPPFRKKKHQSSSHSSDTFESYDQEDESEENESQKSINSSSIEEENPMNNAATSENAPNFKPTSPSFVQLNSRDQYFDSLNHFRNLRRTHENGYFHSNNENEEDKYLNFLSKVTEDILRSGVYSDKAIQQAFEFHMQFYQDETNKDKLQSLLSQVLDGLKISSNESEAIPNQKNPLFMNFNTPPEKESPSLRTDAELNLKAIDESNLVMHSTDLTNNSDIQRDENTENES